MFLKPNGDLIVKFVDCISKDVSEEDKAYRVKLASDCIFTMAATAAGILLLVFGLGEYLSIAGIGTVDYLHSSYIYKKRL